MVGGLLPYLCSCCDLVRRAVFVSLLMMVAVGHQVREMKHCPVWPKDLADCPLQVHQYNVCSCLPGQGLFSAAVSSSSVLSCIYFRKLLLVRSPAKHCTSPSLHNRSFVMAGFTVIICWYSFGLV